MFVTNSPEWEYSLFEDFFEKRLRLWRERKIDVDKFADVYLTLITSQFEFYGIKKKYNKIIDQEIGRFRFYRVIIKNRKLQWYEESQ